MNHVYACLCARDGRESSFHRFGGSVKLVQACLYADNAVLTS